MRGFFRFIGLLIAAAIVAVLAIFAAQNITRVPVGFFGSGFTGNIWWISIGSAVLGFVLAFLLLAPGRVAAGWRGRTLGRERQRLRDELAVVHAREAQLRADHDQLQAQHADVTAERDQLRQSAAPAAAAPVAQAATGTLEATTPETTPAASAPLVPPAQPGGAAASAEAMATTNHPPTLGERLRGALNRSAEPQPEEADSIQGPPVPTA
jgi:uncharacterized integral membrane protein